MEVRGAWKGKHALGRRRIPDYDDVSERVSRETTESDVTERVFPSERVSNGIDLFIDFERGERVEGVDFGETNISRGARFVG